MAMSAIEVATGRNRLKARIVDARLEAEPRATPSFPDNTCAFLHSENGTDDTRLVELFSRSSKVFRQLAQFIGW